MRSNDEWLKLSVEYELLPLIKEYWFDEPVKIEHWSLKFREQSMIKVKILLNVATRFQYIK
jgi:hypothetical protein